MKSLLTLCLFVASAWGQAPAGYATVSFFGTPITVPLAATYAQSQIQPDETISIQALVNEGITSPQALVADFLLKVQGYCQAMSNASPPDCSDGGVAAAAPDAQQLAKDAALVPASQWTNFNPHLASNIQIAVALANAPPPAVAPAGQPLVGACVPDGLETICYMGPGATLASPAPANLTTITNGMQVTQNGHTYLAQLTSFIGMPSGFFIQVN